MSDAHFLPRPPKLPRYVILQKKRGETPLQALHAWKAEHPEWKDIPASYAGRLDPMAEGKLLVLLGNECKKQNAYTKLDKEYVIEVVLDFATDSGDVLGLAEYVGNNSKYSRPTLMCALQSETGMHERAYPSFSKTVHGKPLFLYKLEGTLDQIHIPTHIERIYGIKLRAVQEVARKELKELIDSALSLVPRSDEPSKALGADFRQDEIRLRWKELFDHMPDRKFTVLTLRVTCGSGAYMRTLAERIGAGLATKAFALSIDRTRIGKYRRIGLLGLWTREF